MLNSNVVFVGMWQLVQTGYISVCQKMVNLHVLQAVEVHVNEYSTENSIQ